MGQAFSREITGIYGAAVLTVACVFLPVSSEALKADDGTLIEGAKLCTRYLPRHERQYGIPENLLAAIASTESGRFHKALGLNLPWPWTINVEGAGYFFDTKQEAIAAVQSFQARGISSIDVGCMQVNLHHHPTAFASLDQAFDPAYNVAYAAQFLKSNFEEEGTWRKATADYHSRTPVYGEEYARLVYGQWGRIINKVADARAGRPILNASAMRPAYASYAAAHPHVYHAVHLHDISVARHETSRENGVLVIRPEHVDTDVTQQASLDSNDQGFVSYSRKAEPVSPERSAIAPNGYVNGEPVADHGAQIVHVNAAESKGQFQPSTHIGRASADDLAAPAIPVSAAAVVSGANGASLRDPGPSSLMGGNHAGSSSSGPHDPFVFNN